jgi:hypothetical protein
MGHRQAHHILGREARVAAPVDGAALVQRCSNFLYAFFIYTGVVLIIQSSVVLNWAFFVV